MAESRRPMYNARAKENPESDRWITIGAAWDFKNGDGFAVRLNNTPTNWDGTFILVPPLADEEKKNGKSKN